MTWHQEPKKDVTSCEKLRLGANIRQPADVRMGEPAQGNAWAPHGEYIAVQEATRGTETSKYPEEEKETSIS